MSTEHAINNIPNKARIEFTALERASIDVKQNTLCSIYKAMLFKNIFSSIKGEKRVVNITAITAIKVFFVLFKINQLLTY